VKAIAELMKMDIAIENERFRFYLKRDGAEEAINKMQELETTYRTAALKARKLSKFHPMRFQYMQAALSARYIRQTILD